MRWNSFASRPLSQQDRNFRLLVTDIAWFGLAFPAVNRFLQIYAIHLGAEASQLNWMASLAAVALLMGSSLAVRWLGLWDNSMKATLLPGFGFRLSFFLPALTPFFPAHLQLVWLILAVIVPAIPQGMASVTFLVMFREAVHEEQVPRLLSRRMLALNITLGISGLAMGYWLDQAPYPLNYQVMFVLAFAFVMISQWKVSRVRVPKTERRPKGAERASVNPWRSASFQVIVAIIALTHITFTSVQAMVPLRMMNELRATESFMGLFTVAELAAAAVITLFTGRVVERIGSRSMIAVAMLGSGLSIFLIAVAQSLPVTLVAAAIGGASWTCVGIGLFSYFSEATPMEHRGPFTMAYNQAIFIAMFIGPLVGQALSSHSKSLVMVLAVGAALRVGAGLLTYTHPRAWFGRMRHALLMR